MSSSPAPLPRRVECSVYSLHAPLPLRVEFCMSSSPALLLTRVEAPPNVLPSDANRCCPSSLHAPLPLRVEFYLYFLTTAPSLRVADRDDRPNNTTTDVDHHCSSSPAPSPPRVDYHYNFPPEAANDACLRIPHHHRHRRKQVTYTRHDHIVARRRSSTNRHRAIPHNNEQFHFDNAHIPPPNPYPHPQQTDTRNPTAPPTRALHQRPRHPLYQRWWCPWPPRHPPAPLLRVRFPETTASITSAINFHYILYLTHLTHHYFTNSRNPFGSW